MNCRLLVRVHSSSNPIEFRNSASAGLFHHGTGCVPAISTYNVIPIITSNPLMLPRIARFETKSREFSQSEPTNSGVPDPSRFQLIPFYRKTGDGGWCRSALWSWPFPSRASRIQCRVSLKPRWVAQQLNISPLTLLFLSRDLIAVLFPGSQTLKFPNVDQMRLVAEIYQSF